MGRIGASVLGSAYAFLQAKGYDIFLLRGPSLFRIDPAYFGEYFRYSLFVAVRINSPIYEITRCAKVL